MKAPWASVWYYYDTYFSDTCAPLTLFKHTNNRQISLQQSLDENGPKQQQLTATCRDIETTTATTTKIVPTTMMTTMVVAIPTVVVTTATVVTRMPPIDHVDHIDHAVVVDEVEAMAVEDVMITIIIDLTIQCAIVEVVHHQHLMVVLVPRHEFIHKIMLLAIMVELPLQLTKRIFTQMVRLK